MEFRLILHVSVCRYFILRAAEVEFYTTKHANLVTIDPLHVAAIIDSSLDRLGVAPWRKTAYQCIRKCCEIEIHPLRPSMERTNRVSRPLMATCIIRVARTVQKDINCHIPPPPSAFVFGVCAQTVPPAPLHTAVDVWWTCPSQASELWYPATGLSTKGTLSFDMWFAWDIVCRELSETLRKAEKRKAKEMQFSGAYRSKANFWMCERWLSVVGVLYCVCVVGEPPQFQPIFHPLRQKNFLTPPVFRRGLV